MGTLLSVRFPLGRYHATAWDRSVNEGAVEWPPSPWRLLRALVSTWYTRWPDLPAPVLDGLLDALGDPPSYWTARTRPGHTRHYLPDAGHRSGKVGGTDLALDPFLALSPEDGPHLLVLWDVDLTGEQRGVLAKLAELVPYLGRAESVCEVTLTATATGDEPDETWWRPHTEGVETSRLLAPSRPISRPLLEVTTVAVRKGRRTFPQHTVWVPYARTPAEPAATRSQHQAAPKPTAIRFGLHARAPFKATHGVLVADTMHRAVAKRIDGGRVDLLGHQGAATDHRHAHWVPLPSAPVHGAEIDSMLVWAPVGMDADEVAAIIGTRWLSGVRGAGDGGGYEIRGFPKTTLLLQSVGRIDQVAPELSGPSREWGSLTPYLPVRHHKRTRGSYEDFLAEDVRRELEYRGQTTGVQVVRDPARDRWALEFRRYRAGEHLRKDSRPGYGLRLTFTEPVAGPLMLGQLSHFGFGVFMPDPPRPS